ncbi:MAG: aldehyde dehydrogenase family protein [Rhodospirillales bacterium]
MTALLDYALPERALAGCFIGGEWRRPSGAPLEIENPSRREILCEVGCAREAEVDQAVQAARKAFPAWAALAAGERGRLLSELSARLEAESERIARVLSAETGNAIRTQSRGEVAAAAAVLRYFGGAAASQTGATLPLGPGIFSYTTREPLGVVGAIVPWNAPLLLGALKIAMALATGNTLVLKPAEDAPLANLMLAELAEDLLPPGVLNMITGVGEDVGAALARHRDVDKVSFTGSTAVGKEILHAAADRVANVTLELGGKSPCIIFPDACTPERLDKTVAGILAAMRFARQGQSCTAGSRLFVHASVWNVLTPALAKAASAMVVGDALDEASDIGAVINAERYSAVRDYVAEAQAQGAEFLCGGVPGALGDVSGYQPAPAILHGLDNSWRIAREEVFGPVLAAIPWQDEAEVIRMANDTHYGLAAYVFTRGAAAIIRMTRGVHAGWMQVNQGGGQLPGMSYGGVKQSGMGCEYSMDGALEAYTFRKNVTIAVDE